jgi:hypothetical protein
MDIWCTFLEQFEDMRISSDQCVILEQFRTKLVNVEVSPSAQHLLIVIRQWDNLPKDFEGRLTPVQLACLSNIILLWRLGRSCFWTSLGARRLSHLHDFL